MITPRQAFLTLEYDGKDISSDIRKDVENFTYQMYSASPSISNVNAFIFRSECHGQCF